MNVTIHSPSEEEQPFPKEVAQAHAKFVLTYLQNLSCPLSQKQILLDRIRNRYVLDTSKHKKDKKS